MRLQNDFVIRRYRLAWISCKFFSSELKTQTIIYFCAGVSQVALERHEQLRKQNSLCLCLPFSLLPWTQISVILSARKHPVQRWLSEGVHLLTAFKALGGNSCDTTDSIFHSVVSLTDRNPAKQTWVLCSSWHNTHSHHCAVFPTGFFFSGKFQI